jgi:hypothetical protein
MFSNAASYATTALALFGTASAHVKLKTPTPFSADTLTTSPLNNAKPGTAGSNYPCQLRSNPADTYKVNGGYTQMKVGEKQPLEFDGSASHGGGTCQLAVSLDTEPAPNSTFKVIQVYEGGCPTSGSGNDGCDSFTFTIPNGFPNGKAALAWIWYNKVGNREIYMNCAPIEVTGGADNHDVYDTLPNAYIINLPTSECSSVETSDQDIPFAGQFVKKEQQALIKAATGPSCAASAAAQTEGLKGYKSAAGHAAGGGAYAAPTGAASSSATATSAPSYAAPTAPADHSLAAPGEAAPDSSFASIAYPTLTVSGDAGVHEPSPTAPVSPPAGTGSSSYSSGSGTASDGIICDASHANEFGVGVDGATVWRPVAAGMSCGQYQQRRKRSAVHPAHAHAHARKHARNLGRPVIT